MLKLYGKYFSIHLKSVMQYKGSFFATVIGSFLTSFTVFLGIFFLFQRFHQVEDFTYEQVLLCYGIMLMGFAAAAPGTRFSRCWPTALTLCASACFCKGL